MRHSTPLAREGMRGTMMNEIAVERPTISVIIPTRNRSAYLRQAIESALRVARALPDDERLEIIVVDDHSEDDTAEVVREYDVRCVPAQARGPSAARNTGIHHASGDLLAFLDDDDI